MSKQICKICNSEQMTIDDVRGETSCEDCGYVVEHNLPENSWSPGEFDPGHESRRPIPMTSEQTKRARRLDHTMKITNPKTSVILAEINRLLDTEYSDLPEQSRKIIMGVIAKLFARNASIPKIRKVTGRELHLAIILKVMAAINHFCDIQLPVVRLERESGLDSRDLVWIKRKISEDMHSILGVGHRHVDSSEARRDEIRRVTSEYFGYMNSDDELSRELVSRLKQLTNGQLREKGEPLETAFTGSRAVRVVVREAIIEASLEMTLSPSQRKAIAKHLSGAKRSSTFRRGSSSSTA
jgi:transcription initiation factor TFIIIB Brf1 subunit/transcription initiation factor TFIIB